KVRLMVVGAVIDSPEYIQLIEDVGAAVVADRFCFGSLPGMEPIDETGDPYISMATHYLSTCECPRMVENWRGRIDSIVKWAQEFNVDGVVIESIKFCDWWGYEVLTMINSLEQHGIPVVKIEREYSYANEGQFRTRIQAFIESLEHKDKQISTMGGSLHEDV
ncbi:MAG: 2-hydroxyacyl-CoA dehydratase family protein, partial [Evtepia sp.]